MTQDYTYTLDFSRYYDHLVDIEIKFIAPCAIPVLWLPTWIAGSYLIREFSKNITAVYYDVAGKRHVADKFDKNHFFLSKVRQGDKVTVRYEVYCHDLSVRTAFVDTRRIFGNFTSLLLMVTSKERDTCQITLTVPQDFLQQNPNTQLAIGLPCGQMNTKHGTSYYLQVLPAIESYDYPFEIGEQSMTAFNVRCHDKDIRHRFFIAGQHSADLHRLTKDVAQICQSYVNWLGDVPFGDYTFMTMVTGSDYGGLEHGNSTVLISSRDDLPSISEPDVPSDDYQRFLGLCSHEYFHAWWVKTVRPDVMMDNDLQSESYTPLLWVFEGFTSYLDDLMLLVSGVIDRASYFKLLGEQINRHYQTDGRLFQSVEQSSFDTWIKLYRPDENSKNQGVSYYNKGALVALCLDLTLLDKTDGKHRLFDVVRAFYDKAKLSPTGKIGVSTDELDEVIGLFVGQDAWQAFYRAYVAGTQELPLDELLGKFGATLTHHFSPKPWGMTADDTAQGLKVSHIRRDSSASRAGVAVGDVIVAIDGIKASTKRLKQVYQTQKITGESVTVHGFCRDELYCVQIGADGDKAGFTQISFGDYQECGWLNFDKSS